MGTSNNKALSQEDIQKLLRTGGKNSRPEPWPNDKELRTLALAVKAEEETVFLGKTEFSIRYHDKYQAVFIKPTSGGYVPCGYINYSRLRDVLKRS